LTKEVQVKKIILFIAVVCAILPGCGNLSPRQQQKIDNQNGKIGEIETMANSMKAEVGNLKANADIQNSKLDRIQNGLANIQANVENHNENSGVQILSGSGGLMIIALAIFGGIMSLYYRYHGKKSEKTANLLAERIVTRNDPVLVDNVFQAAMYSDVEEHVLNLIKKKQNLL
jgi:predicted PurR-regulated permease PerM